MIIALLYDDDGSIQKTRGFILVQARALHPVSKDDRVRVPLLNALKFLQWGARMVEEVGELELGDGLPKGKLQEPYYDGE